MHGGNIIDVVVISSYVDVWDNFRHIGDDMLIASTYWLIVLTVSVKISHKSILGALTICIYYAFIWIIYNMNIDGISGKMAGGRACAIEDDQLLWLSFG